MKQTEARQNFEASQQAIGYVDRQKATPKDYLRIGFKSGLEVHQQLKTTGKLFCRCPAGVYQADDDFDAEVIRHMRPTLSELGEYDGTALMEFRTKKQITYRLNNASACTYETDDTPPFPIDREALDIALEIALLCDLNIVGEVHITRKQYLDGSIPTGFQRTAILGVEGALQLRNKTVRLIQLSIEEDSCREISDIGHSRIYKTDRLGMPLIETVTYPDLGTPDELAEAAETIRFLNRSTGKVRTGMGAGREDVNVSCAGGTRVEIKGVAHNKWIPKLAHNEAYRQWALLHIRQILHDRGIKPDQWQLTQRQLDLSHPELITPALREKLDLGYHISAINLPQMQGILSHFTQPGHPFIDEIIHRLKVIACIERPNLTHSEALEPLISNKAFTRIRHWLQTDQADAQIILWGPAEDIPTALETIEERFMMAFDGVPPETRKALPDGTTIFERVLPGSDRMYPDTDSAPIPLSADHITQLGQDLPLKVAERYQQLNAWGVPEDTWNYLLSKNLLPLIERISAELGFPQRYLGIFFGQTLKAIEGRCIRRQHFSYEKLYELFCYIRKQQLEPRIAGSMLAVIFKFPDMQFSSVLTSIHFKRRKLNDIMVPIEILINKCTEKTNTLEPAHAVRWIMGQLRCRALGNIPLSELRQAVERHLIGGTS